MRALSRKSIIPLSPLGLRSCPAIRKPCFSFYAACSLPRPGDISPGATSTVSGTCRDRAPASSVGGFLRSSDNLLLPAFLMCDLQMDFEKGFVPELQGAFFHQLTDENAEAADDTHTLCLAKISETAKRLTSLLGKCSIQRMSVCIFRLKSLYFVRAVLLPFPSTSMTPTE